MFSWWIWVSSDYFLLKSWGYSWLQTFHDLLCVCLTLYSCTCKLSMDAFILFVFMHLLLNWACVSNAQLCTFSWKQIILFPYCEYVLTINILDCSGPHTFMCKLLCNLNNLICEIHSAGSSCVASKHVTASTY